MAKVFFMEIKQFFLGELGTNCFLVYNDLGAYVISEAFPRGAQSHQVVIYELEIDVLPYDHSITIKVYDTGASLPGDRHYDLQLNMRQDGEFTSDGELVDPENFVFRELWLIFLYFLLRLQPQLLVQSKP